MKKILSFAVAVVMLLSLSIPMTYAAPETTGTASKVGSVEGGSEAYIAKMGYAEAGSGWTAITSVAQLKGISSGNYYLSGDIEFQSGDHALGGGSERWATSEFGTITIDGCGYSISGWDYTGTKAYLFKVKSGNTFILKNAIFSDISINVTSGCISVLGVVDGTAKVDNVSITADIYTTFTNYANNNGISGFFSYAGDKSNIEISNSEMNGSVTQDGQAGNTLNAGVTGFVAASRGAVTITNCVNNARIEGYDVVAGIIASRENGDKKFIENCVNNGQIISTRESKISNAFVGPNGTQAAKITVTDCVNTGMLTSLIGGVVTTTVPTGVNGAQAFIQMTNGAETQDVRFILAMSEAEYEANKADLTFKVTFKVDGQYLSMDLKVENVLTTVEGGDMIYNAADGVVLCGVIVEDVPTNEWTACALSYNGAMWTYAK